jgi:DNA-3-methyladenine glycosylase I
MKYHDQEWGVPLIDEQKLFEMLILEGMQAGLSWLTILRKREHIGKAFKQFDAKLILKMTDEDLNALMQDKNIIRNRLKIYAVRKNARAFLQVQEEFSGFRHFIWQFVEGKQKQNKRCCIEDIPATSKESDAMSKALKKRGFSFVGSTICYAYMQSVGMVNDHITSCFRFKELQQGGFVL